MITVKSQFPQLTLSVITLFLVVGALSMIWPAILALFQGVLLLQSLGTEPEMGVLSWNEVGHVPILVASLRRPRSSGNALMTSSSGAFVGRAHSARRDGHLSNHEC